ncbi:hypothetical protein HMPREF1395_01747 [Helicobacter pylori GAM112Ai]|nr:hypothetical protein HMPREF1395_01747 [Helicobacter pylori GAM112Ai]EMH32236.1 hypothetical protein HMPREF1424_01170 [Helicobacter pylori GAM42Ai]
MVKLPFHFKDKHCSIFRLKNAFYIFYIKISLLTSLLNTNPFF